MFRFVFIIALAAFVLSSCGFDNNSIIMKRLNLIESRVDFNSKRIEENSKKIDEIELKLQQIKQRLAKERQEDILANIPPASVVDNLSSTESFSDSHQAKDNPQPQKDSEIEKKANRILSYITQSTKKEERDNASLGFIPPPPKTKTIIKKPSNKPQVDTKDYKALYREALGYYKKGDYSKAKELFERFIGEYKNTDLFDNALFWLAYTHIHLGNIDKATQLLKRIIEEFPQASVDKGGKTDAAIFALIKIYKKQNDKKLEVYYRDLLIKRFPYSNYVNLIKRRRKG
ncbi:tetratricopeptide repeat protein [Hippea sp. KM1]|uniref:tetratricopeptide repeat protein n=1 Tax=Hippea sp. KM1 TaxID=944481 RepID=UPI00046D39EE|nr:tetratricopeptide repeat protein [Hippea sp. KM1]